MSSKHATAPWFGVPEATQASLMLEAIQEEIATLPSSQQSTTFRLPTQEEISTIPLNPFKEEVTPEESLPSLWIQLRVIVLPNCPLSRNFWWLKKEKQSLPNLLPWTWRPSKGLANLLLATSVDGSIQAVHMVQYVPTP